MQGGFVLFCFSISGHFATEHCHENKCHFQPVNALCTFCECDLWQGAAGLGSIQHATTLSEARANTLAVLYRAPEGLGMDVPRVREAGGLQADRVPSLGIGAHGGFVFFSTSGTVSPPLSALPCVPLGLELSTIGSTPFPVLASLIFTFVWSSWIPTEQSSVYASLIH